MTPPPVLAVLASVGVVAPDADVTDLPAIVDVAAEADIALGIAPVMIAILIPVLAGVTRAHQPGNAKAVVAALDVGDRSHPHRIVITAAKAVAAVPLVIAIAIFGLSLGHGGGGALGHRLAVRHIVAVAEQRIDDLADRVLGIALVVAGIPLLSVAVAWLARVRLRDLLILLLILLLVSVGISSLRSGRNRKRADRRRGGEIMGTNCHGTSLLSPGKRR